MRELMFDRALIAGGCASSCLLSLLLMGCAGGGSPNPAASTPTAVPVQPALTITTSGNLTPGTFGQFYKTTLQASGGTPPYEWIAVQGDPLVSGLTLSMDTGELSGVLTGQVQFMAGGGGAQKPNTPPTPNR